MSSETHPGNSSLHRSIMRWILAAFFAAAGTAHLMAPDKLLAITPSWVPFAPQVIFITACANLPARAPW
jgi:uncharacterized membrane protein